MVVDEITAGVMGEGIRMENENKQAIRYTCGCGCVSRLRSCFVKLRNTQK